ncbi:hypothetical protein ACHAXR_009348 [Thalassiosira sp. AJA248-18]
MKTSLFATLVTAWTDCSKFLFLEQMYGNHGTCRYLSSMNGTEGLHCTSTIADADEMIFKQRKLTDNAGIVSDEFFRCSRLLSEY